MTPRNAGTPRSRAKNAAKRLAAAEAHAEEVFAEYILDLKERRGLPWIVDRLGVTRQSVWYWYRGTVPVSANVIAELMKWEGER